MSGWIEKSIYLAPTYPKCSGAGKTDWETGDYHLEPRHTEEPAPGLHLPLLLLLAGVQEAGGGAGGEGEEVPRHGPRSIEIRRSEWPGSAGLEVASF